MSPEISPIAGLMALLDGHRRKFQPITVFFTQLLLTKTYSRLKAFPYTRQCRGAAEIQTPIRKSRP